MINELKDKLNTAMANYLNAKQEYYIAKGADKDTTENLLDSYYEDFQEYLWQLDHDINTMLTTR